ncbi:MAG: Antibiotic biosynthesis monooxygenase [Sphingomonas bacterium]|uniref:putative quinol monooxygenase n=1 Tax=Sphingomonas bacterium TaxID=1895847 RepID=UPI0026108C6E|nr:putative quinol monooxygenase [Sphingomonas bacterium]MDB5707618.1 Antibiotic biosynthesis monooxygenase [Sphingomonas bacterium]
MTILVMGYIRAGAGEGAKLRDLLVAHMAATNAEQGCEFYNFAYDLGDPDLIRISERWTSEEALAAHGAADHQKALAARLRDFDIKEVSVKGWDGQFWRTLIGE